MTLPLRILFLLNAAATFVAAAVLFLAPDLIPAVAGAAVPAEALLVPRLLGAYELALGVLCVAVLLRPVPELLRAGLWVLIAVHAASALAEAITALTQGVSAVVLANLVLRLVLVVLLLAFGRHALRVTSTGR